MHVCTHVPWDVCESQRIVCWSVLQGSDSCFHVGSKDLDGPMIWFVICGQIEWYCQSPCHIPCTDNVCLDILYMPTY